MIVVPPSYFPPISVFCLLILQNETLVLDDRANFQKQTIRNRCDILGANGRIRLTVPLRNWSTHVPISEILVDNEKPWKRNHAMSIRSAYGNSPFFTHYESDLESLYNKEHDTIVDLALDTHRILLAWFGSNIEIRRLSEVENKQDRNMNLDDYSHLFTKKHNGSVRIPRYQQVFSDRFDFENDLSILDLLFNLGPRSVQYMHDLRESSAH